MVPSILVLTQRDQDFNNFLDGQIDETRWYVRGLSDNEIACLAAGLTQCPRGKYYPKPYNTQSCNRPSEEIQTPEECESAIGELLTDGRIGNSLNGGVRFGKVIVDKSVHGSLDVTYFVKFIMKFPLFLSERFALSLTG